jgi:hydroxymethylbilane synthase
MRLLIGTRGSALARRQASWVGSLLQERFEGTHVEYETIKTKGDKLLDVPLAKVGGKGLFVKEIEEALLAGQVDLAVHSVKDIPASLPDGLTITAIPEREDPRDVLISKDGETFQRLRKGARVGTSSLRRRALLLKIREDIHVVPMRGNLDTRIRKMEQGVVDAVVLAAAGIRRMGLESRITEILSPREFIPAIGQGALGIETRMDDEKVNALVRALDHPETRLCVRAERAFLKSLHGGCQVPIGGLAKIHGNRMTLHGMVADLDGKPMFLEEIQGDPMDAQQLGKELAVRIMRQGAREILETLYGRQFGVEDV